MTTLVALSGWLAFAVLGVFTFRRLIRAAKSDAELQEAQKRLTEQEARHRESQAQLEQSFKALAAEALTQSSESFLKLASERLDKKTIEGRAAFDEKVTQFNKLIEPIREALSKVETDLNRVEKDRLAQFSKLSEQLFQVSQSSESLRKEASSLTSALRRPEVRGSWGEIQLRRVVELAGMSSYCDFEEQVTATKEDSLQKPDMIVRLPNERVIIVDSKAVLDAFLDATQAEDSEKKKDALARHARNIRSRVASLAKKSYWEQFEHAPDFCVLFIPNEALLASAVEVDRDLIEDALADRIVIATPTTLVALLKAVAYGWQQNQLTENAQQVIQSAKEFYERISTWSEHMSQVGSKLESAVKSYNSAVGSLESRVLPSARKMNELGLFSQSSVPTLEPIDEMTRQLNS